MLRYRRENDSVSMNMTPLIDVVFLLIIFFLVSSHLARQETQLDLDLPDAASGELAQASTARVVTVNLLPTGELMVAGESTPAAELTAKLEREVQRDQTPVEVRLRSDRSVPYGDVEPILAACAKANVWNLRFAVREPGPGEGN
ncbi:biopolymer transport protein ExbD [Posidoniimonas polymericola]|uniref:Biopolymer transport protein ExbD n=1 Tax=Posidoniimonas polymericola TaxID=2528002 RepID=A0A5C5YGD0_9BACT|nr:biopolymer transporter ExbD [Posidoniimonas polymericola]TWT73581.1 biopolymer transport protein ExbD [Posidoniimonas polymericola]